LNLNNCADAVEAWKYKAFSVKRNGKGWKECKKYLEGLLGRELTAAEEQQIRSLSKKGE
jgi:hypothetical protein